MNKCHLHPDRDADGTCSVCGRYFCDECLVPVRGTHVCKDCVPALIPEEGAPVQPPPKCYSVFVGLALILGFLGAHYFYVGKTSSAVFMLILSAVSVFFTSVLDLPPLGVFIMGFIALIQAAVGKNDGYGRPMV